MLVNKPHARPAANCRNFGAGLMFSVLLFVTPFNLFPQEFTPNPDWRFESFNSQSHFTSGSIAQLALDEKGYVWTSSVGLQRFDGYHTVEFNKFNHSNGSIRSNVVGVVADKAGKVWISSSGLCSYDDASGKFIYIQPDAKHNFKIADAIFIQNNYLWFVCEFGLAKLDTRSQKISYTSLTHVTDPLCSYLVNDSTLLVSSREKVYFYNIKTDSWSCRTLVYNHDLLKIFVVTKSKKEVFLGTNYGLFTLSNSNALTMICPETRDAGINDLAFLPADKQQKYLFIATEGKGMLIYNTLTKKVEFRYLHDDDNPYSIPFNDISGFFVDRKGRLWLCGDAGIGMLDIFNQPLKMRFSNQANIYGLGINRVAADKFDSTKVWMSSYNQGMIAVNWKTKQIEAIYNKNPRARDIYDFAQISKKKWLLTTQKEIIIWSPGTGPIARFKLPLPDSVALVCNIRRIIMADAGSCYITTNRGLFKFDLRTNTVSIPANNCIWQKGKDPLKYILLSGFYEKGMLWIASRNGVFSYDIASRTATIYAGKGNTPDYYFFDITNGPKNQLVCAGGQGITVFDKQTKNFQVINSLGDFYKPACIGVIAVNNAAWISTEVGILNYNLGTNRSERAELGMSPTEVGTSSPFALIGRDIVFGFRNGFGYFTPGLKNNVTPSDPVIERVYVNNEPVLQNYRGKLVFSHSDNSINIAFTAFLYNDPEQIKFRYRLTGADRDWHYTQGQRGANYAQLPPGEYSFYVQCGNKNGIWNKNPASFNFIINPPYWATWWFRALILATAAVGLYRLYKYKIEHLHAIEKIRANIASDFHDDLGSTLSSISIFSEVAIQKAETDLATTKNMVGDIGTRARAMIHLMNDVVWIIKPENDSLYRLMQRMEEFAYPVAEAKEIRMEFLMDKSLHNIKIDMVQRKNLFLIFKEAFNNAIKYSNADNISIQFTLKQKKALMMQITDNGCGFEYENTPKGNGLGNMNRRAAEIKGKLKIITAIGGGTTISISCEIT